MKFIPIWILILAIGSSECRKRARTTTSTEVPVSLELTLADRESALLDREESFRKRETVFREREEKLSQREAVFQEREDKLSKREKNIALREQNTLKGKCGTGEDSIGAAAAAPDYTLQRYDSETNKLQDLADISTCSDNMRFFALPDNETLGRCDCDYHQCSRPLIYSEKYKQCFWAWSQGPCEQNEWFVYDVNYMPICEINPCPASPAIGMPSYYFQNPEDSKCYKAGAKGPCKKKGERLFTIPNDPIPKCRSTSICPSQTVPAIQRCIPGNRRYFDGLCGSTSDSSSSADDDEESESEHE